jgi:hypothetical protein
MGEPLHGSPRGMCGDCPLWVDGPEREAQRVRLSAWWLLEVEHHVCVGQGREDHLPVAVGAVHLRTWCRWWRDRRRERDLPVARGDVLHGPGHVRLDDGLAGSRATGRRRSGRSRRSTAGKAPPPPTLPLTASTSSARTRSHTSRGWLPSRCGRLAAAGSVTAPNGLLNDRL